MKHFYCLFFCFLFIFPVNSYAQKNFQKKWNKVEQLELKGKTGSANSLVIEIYKKAKTKNNDIQLIKSLLYQSKFALSLKEDAPLKINLLIVKEIEDANSPLTKAILRSILAEFYADYLDQNDWKNKERTPTKILSKDFREWDNQTLARQIIINYKKSLQNKKLLQNAKIEKYEPLILESGLYPVKTNSLFELLSYRALNFLKKDLDYVDKPINAFHIIPSKTFTPPSKFIHLNLHHKDSLSANFQALKIFQGLEKYHLKKGNEPVLARTAVMRFKFLNNKTSAGLSLIVNAFRELTSSFKNKQAVSISKSQLAHFLNLRANKKSFPNDKIEAVALCKNVISNNNDKISVGNCKNLLNLITNSQLIIKNEKVVPIDQFSKILVNFRNLDSLEIKIFKLNLQEYSSLQTKLEPSFRFHNKDSIFYNFKKDKIPVYSKIEILPKKKDYFEHSTELLIPKLKAGFYLISANPTTLGKPLFATNLFQVSDLSLLASQKNNNIQYKVLHRINGKSLKNVQIEIDGSKNNDQLVAKILKTNPEGKTSFQINSDYYNLNYLLTKEKDSLYISSGHYIRNHVPREEKIVSKAFLFTDRSIYRPGQKLYFKGIIVRKNKENRRAVPNRHFKVIVKDANRSELKTYRLKTNAFGSFHGEFTIPTGLRTGEFSIKIEEDEEDYSDEIDEFIETTQYFSVEEYKRPKFKITFAPFSEKYVLNEEVIVRGKAKSYFGTGISNADLNYRIIRYRMKPLRFFGWGFRYIPTDKQEIAQGNLITDKEGNFKISFTAKPNTQYAPSELPVFQYKILVSVTDINGETRSNSAVMNIGYHALNLNLKSVGKSEKGEDFALKYSAENLNGEPMEAIGTLSIYKLKSPNRILKTRSWPAPELPSIAKKNYVSYFPHAAYKNKDDFRNWEKGKKIYYEKINFKGKNELLFEKTQSWIPGKYSAIIKSTDEHGNSIKAETFFSIFDEGKKTTEDKILFDYFILNKNFREDGFIGVKLISSTKNLKVRTEAFYKGRPLIDNWVGIKNNSEIIQIPIKQNFTGKMKLRFSFLKFNQPEKIIQEIILPDSTPKMQIHLTTFRNKIKPGEPETWTLHIENLDPEKQAELLASMYDISLDQFKPHSWLENLKLYQNRYFYVPNLNYLGFGIDNFSVHNYIGIHYEGMEPNLPELRDFGFSYANFPESNYKYLTRLLFPDTKPQYRFISEGGKIKGKVLSLVYGTPLPEVNIIVEGANMGTLTDLSGEFTIKTKKGDRLIPSYLGFNTGGLFLWKDGFLTIYMTPSHHYLNEVVTVEYAEQVEESIVGAVPFAKISIRGVSKNNPPPKSKVQIADLEMETRKNLRETAFFMPQLKTDEDGNIKIEFKSPESLTQWKLMLFAHNKKAKSAYKEATTITQKELMVVPNAPRFLRENDTITLSAKITNITEKDRNGIAQLQVFNALNNKRLDLSVNNAGSIRKFVVSKNGNTSVAWKLIVPEGISAIHYKIMAKTDNFTDGIEDILPVLTNRMLVTETLAFWLRSHSTEKFYLKKLSENTSNTLKNHSLTLEYTSNPAWYAILSLPYLIQYPYECSEQTFAKYYANSLAYMIANSSPKIRKVFESWRENGSLDSKFQMNEELKSILLKETPWVMEAKSEAERHKEIAVLFDRKKLKKTQNNLLLSLEAMQLSSGGFPWFKGGRPNFFITTHILAGFGHLEQLDALNEDEKLGDITKNAIDYLDREFLERYKEGNHLSSIHYLYARSFYMKDYPLPEELKPIIDKLIEIEKESWFRNSLYAKAMLALIFNRMNKKETAKQIIVSLKENAITTKESGMYWKTNETGRFWFNSSIETQALIIEAFAEIVPKDPSIEELKVWLLKNKRTNNWESTKATTEAIYALLLQGKDWLAQDYKTEIQIGEKQFQLSEGNNENGIAGTGYFKKVWFEEEIVPKMAQVTVKNKSNVPSYGGLYWQYFEDLDKITGSQNKEIKMNKQIYLKENSGQGPVLTLINENSVLEVGDLITVRITLDVNSRFEYVHLKDMRASGLEPVNVLSTHKSQDGLWYYQSTQDIATNFFFDVLPKGNYVFEYNLRVNNAGNFSNGITTIQCMYAPEFTSHSKGIRISVKK